MTPHAYDWETRFCLGCGCAMQAVVKADRGEDCPAAPNVIAISHRIAKRQGEALLADVRAVWDGWVSGDI